MRLEAGVAGASAVLGLVAMLSYRDAVVHWNRQNAYSARVDGLHTSVPGFARSPSWIDLDK